MAALKQKEPWEVSGCASEDKFEQLCRTHYPHYALGTDRLGRPVLVHQVCLGEGGGSMCVGAGVASIFAARLSVLTTLGGLCVVRLG